jgi:hypothetical protein
VTRSISSSSPGSPSIATGTAWATAAATTIGLLPLLSPRAARVAGAFDLQIVPQVPVGPNDIGIDAVVTESRELSSRDERTGGR